MIDVVLNPELATDDIGDPSSGPHLSSEPERFRTAGQQDGQFGELLGCQPRGGARWRAMAQARNATLPATAHPLADCTLGHT